MKDTFSIVFKNLKNETYRLQFKIYKTDISKRWFSILQSHVHKSGNKIHESDRLYGFLQIWNEETIVNELNLCIEKINSYNKVITHYAYIGMPQEHLNILHHYFENLRGSINSPSMFWINAADSIKNAIERYNVLIHRAEDYYNTQLIDEKRIVCTFKNKERFLLKDRDYKYFTLLKNFGEVYINYCEVGKPLQDIFKDNDSIVGEDNIRPLRYYSPDFRVHFHNTSKSQVNDFLKQMDLWWNKNHNYLTALGFTKNDPKNSIGHIPIAKIVTNKSEKEIIDDLCKYSILDSIEI